MKGDIELWNAWRAGDSLAGNELIERFFPSVYRFFATKVPDAADDLTQATFTACVETIGRQHAGPSFRAYVLGIARIQLLRFFEGRGLLMGGRAASEISIADMVPSPSSVAAQSQHRAMLVGAMQKLPLDLQIVLELHYWEGFETPEVAQVLEIPIGTAKSRLSRARRQLEQVLRRPGASRSTLPLADELRAAIER